MAFSSFKGPVILDVPSEPGAMFMVRTLVGAISERIGFGPLEADKLVLAVDEACTNVIRHAYDNSGDGRIVITFTLGPDYFEITVRDFGSGGDPAAFTGRNLDQVRPGGLGLHFIKSAVDKVEYDTPPGGGMLLKMTKFMPGQENDRN